MTGSSLIAFAQCETTALLTCVPVVQNNMGKGENESNGTFVESTLFESETTIRLTVSSTPCILFFFTYLHQDDAIYSHNSQITFHQSTDRATEGGEASNKKIQDEVKQSRFPRHANTSRAPDRASPLYIPGCVKSPCRTPAIVCKTSRVEPIPQFQRMVGARREQRCWGGEGGRRQSGSVRSCLLIPELTASLCVRQTPQPRVAPPWRNVHTPLLHATDCTPSFAPSSWVLFVPGMTHKRARALTQPHTRSCP